MWHLSSPLTRSRGSPLCTCVYVYEGICVFFLEGGVEEVGYMRKSWDSEARLSWVSYCTPRSEEVDPTLPTWLWTWQDTVHTTAEPGYTFTFTSRYWRKRRGQYWMWELAGWRTVWKISMACVCTLRKIWRWGGPCSIKLRGRKCV